MKIWRRPEENNNKPNSKKFPVVGLDFALVMGEKIGESVQPCL
jgi:hypothetical protein